jgi:hypothetical protein
MIHLFGPLSLEIAPSFGFKASVGPGVIENAKVEAGFKPFAEDKDFEITASALFSVPTFVGVNAGLRIGAGLDVFIGSAMAGVKFTGGIGLEGKNSIAVVLHYKNGVFDARLDAAIDQEIVATLDIVGYARVKGLGAELWSHEWKLYSTKWPTGWKLYIFVPVEYHSNKPFQLPDASKMKIEFPSLSISEVKKKVSDQLDRASA